jgi:hypothetical protein
MAVILRQAGITLSWLPSATSYSMITGIRSNDHQITIEGPVQIDADWN